MGDGRWESACLDLAQLVILLQVLVVRFHLTGPLEVLPSVLMAVEDVYPVIKLHELLEIIEHVFSVTFEEAANTRREESISCKQELLRFKLVGSFVLRSEGCLRKTWKLLLGIASVEVVQQVATSMTRYVVYFDFALVYLNLSILSH